MAQLFQNLLIFYLTGVVATIFLWVSQYIQNRDVWDAAIAQIIKSSTAENESQVYSAIFLSCLLSWITILAFIYVSSIK